MGCGATTQSTPSRHSSAEEFEDSVEEKFLDEPPVSLGSIGGMMRKTIDLLLSLPESERTKMEEAIAYTFTQEAPAPQLEVEDGDSDKKPVCFCMNMGTAQATALLCEEGLRPAVLNFAHSYNCGGGFEHANGSQEEDLFRKTSAFLSLWPHRRSDDGPGVLARGLWIGEYDDALPRKEPFYPHTVCGGVYTPHTKVVRDMRQKDYPALSGEEILEAPTFGLLTVAAQDVRREPPFDPKLLKQKVRTVLHMAAVNKHDALVLGAFGTGYFCNPPQEVAKAFADALSKEFASAFRIAVFAVPDRYGPTLDSFVKFFPVKKEKQLKALLAGN